jgi:hypothetical protein
MIRIQTCHIAVCDGCENEYEHDYIPHWPSSADAVEEVVDNADWWASKDRLQLLCSDCKFKPHAFVESDLYPDDCDRCSNPADEHAQVVPA